jgi:hypothetical protein
MSETNPVAPHLSTSAVRARLIHLFDRRRAFDFLAVTRLRKALHGSRAPQSRPFTSLREANGRRLHQLSPSDFRSLVRLTLRYLDLDHDSTLESTIVTRHLSS